MWHSRSASEMSPLCHSANPQVNAHLTPPLHGSCPIKAQRPSSSVVLHTLERAWWLRWKWCYAFRKCKRKKKTIKYISLWCWRKKTHIQYLLFICSSLCGCQSKDMGKLILQPKLTCNFLAQMYFNIKCMFAECRGFFVYKYSHTGNICKQFPAEKR